MGYETFVSSRLRYDLIPYCRSTIGRYLACDFGTIVLKVASLTLICEARSAVHTRCGAWRGNLGVLFWDERSSLRRLRELSFWQVRIAVAYNTKVSAAATCRFLFVAFHMADPEELVR